MKNNFFGILPSIVRHHKSLKPNAKLIFSEIMACLDSNGVCTKPNIYFSKVFDITKTTASTCVSALRELGFISVIMEYEKGTNKLLNRYITPINLFNGVGIYDSDSHISYFKGVDVVNPLDNDADESNQPKRLLYNNNNIIKIYSVKKNKVILNRGINEKQKNALMKIVSHFYSRQSSRFSDLFIKKWDEDSSLINGSLNTLYDLIIKDKYDYEEIRDVLNWAVDDSFWGVKLIMLTSLRTMSANGMRKFANVRHQYKNFDK